MSDILEIAHDMAKDLHAVGAKRSAQLIEKNTRDQFTSLKRPRHVDWMALLSEEMPTVTRPDPTARSGAPVGAATSFAPLPTPDFGRSLRSRRLISRRCSRWEPH